MDSELEKDNHGLGLPKSITFYYATCPGSSSFSNKLGVSKDSTNNNEDNGNDDTMSKEKEIPLKDRIFTVKGMKRDEMVAKANGIGVFLLGNTMSVIEQKVIE